MNALDINADRPAPRAIAAVHPTHTFRLLLRREFWEHRGGFLWAPLLAGAIFLLLATMGIGVGELAARRVADSSNHAMISTDGGKFEINGLDLSRLTEKMSADDMRELGGAVDGLLLMAGSWPLMVLAFVVFFYCLGSLYDERKDRSVLFWKSLPVSDVSTVLSKAVWALLLAPIVAIGVGLLIGVALWVVTALTVSVNGITQSSAVFTHSHPLRIIGGVLSNVPIYVMWALPTIGWLMFCSAWARTKPFLWAVLLPILGCVMASMMAILPMLHVNHKLVWYTVVYRGLLSMLPGTWLPVLSETAPPAQIDGPQDLANAIQLSDAWRIFQSADIWIGAAIGVAFIVAAIYLRRWRDEA
jgi:ABC-2 type transport system permease protein